MVNAVDMAKRALVKLLKELAVLYSLTLGVTRDSPDPAVRTAHRKVSVKTHPDHGGDADHQRQLNAAYSTWETAAKEKQKHGGKDRRGKAAKEKAGGDANAAASAREEVGGKPRCGGSKVRRIFRCASRGEREVRRARTDDSKAKSEYRRSKIEVR